MSSTEKPSDNRTRQINVKLTLSEHDYVIRKAAGAGKNISVYIRERVLSLNSEDLDTIVRRAVREELRRVT